MMQTVYSDGNNQKSSKVFKMQQNLQETTQAKIEEVQELLLEELNTPTQTQDRTRPISHIDAIG